MLWDMQSWRLVMGKVCVVLGLEKVVLGSCMGQVLHLARLQGEEPGVGGD